MTSSFSLAISCLVLLVVAASARKVRKNRPLVEQYLRTDHGDQAQCQPMQSSPMRECGAQMGYNYTRMPNLLNYATQRDALQQFRGFDMLLRQGCSSELRLLLCLFYFPSCSTGPGRVHMVVPCRPLCERVSAACADILASFNFSWPESLRCDRLPSKRLIVGSHGEKVVCVSSAAAPDMDWTKARPPTDTESTTHRHNITSTGMWSYTDSLE